MLSLSLGLVFGIVSARSRGNKIDLSLLLWRLSVPVFLTSLSVRFCSISCGQVGTLPYSSVQRFSAYYFAFDRLSSIQWPRFRELCGPVCLRWYSRIILRPARSKGISNFRITWKHQIRNAIMPVVTVLGPYGSICSYRYFVIESIFAIPRHGQVLC